MNCSFPTYEKEIITLAHGSGGKEMSHLIEKMFLSVFSNPHVKVQHDGASLTLPSKELVFTTDSYVVQPLFFPGGDIGTLAVTGTINDLAMCGAKPLFLSCSFIIEEGFSQQDLQTIVNSIQKEAENNSVHIVTGDTKVIERMNGNNIFVNTAGIGTPLFSTKINPKQIQPGDAILLSGDVGRHGMAIMAARNNLSFTSPLESDCASLFPIVQNMHQKECTPHCLRDATRGGLATLLVELAEESATHFLIDEEKIPVSQSVKSACEVLGIDPFYVANEGRCVAIVPKDQAQTTLDCMRQFPEGKEATLIGHVKNQSSHGKVEIKNSFGSSRYLYKLVGEQLPRIC